MSRTPLQPVRWDPPEAPALKGRYAPNSALDVVERLVIPDGVGPEDVVVDTDGRVYTGIEDGRILRFDAPGARPTVVSATYGRPLGIELDADGHLIVADAYRGLLRIDPVDGAVQPLVKTFLGRRLKLTNNATVATDGTIYFTESTDRFDLSEYKRDLYEHRPAGRVLAYHPDGQVELITDGLHFANGVALAADESWLAVCETGTYRITKVWLTGPDAGKKEPLIENLPGFPDNLSHNGAGVFWVPMASPRQKPLDALLKAPPILRKVVDALPESVQPDALRYAIVLGIDEQGEVAHNLQGPTGAYGVVTGVREHDGWLYLGSLVEDAVARVKAPAGA